MYIEIRANNDVMVIEADQFRIEAGILYVESLTKHSDVGNLQTFTHNIVLATRNWDFVGYLNPDQVITWPNNITKTASVYIDGMITQVIVHTNRYITQ